MNILIIEDDLFLARNIEKIFEKKVVTNRIKIISDYKQFALELSIINSYDIILVDICLWVMEKKTGIDFISLIRDKNKSIPVIVVSWYDELSYLEKAFSVWANDYITKPFRFRELEIRVFKWFAIYFYSDLKATENIKYFWLEYCMQTNEFYYNWKILNLTKSNKYLLSLFLSNREILLKENYLIEKIWGDISCIIERNLRVSILRLKRALEKHCLDSWICNIRGEGYILKK